MNLSSDDESSDSETEYVRPNDKIDLNSSLFKNAAKRKIQEESNEVSSDSDDDEDLPTYTNTELLSQIMKNLEETNKAISSQNRDNSQDSGIDVQEPRTSADIIRQDSITSLLLQGEQNLDSSISSETDFIPPVPQEPEKPVTISKSIEIVCPFTSDLLKRRGKKKPDLQEELRNRLNKRLRAHQLLLHKVGILCWLSHGFYLNRLMNNPEILGVALSLVSPNNYPKTKADKNYILKFTLWYRKTFQINKNIARDTMNKSDVLSILESKSVKDEKELALIYVTILRAMGIQCRLVISLCPPERLVKKDKLLPSADGSDKKGTEKSSKEKSPKEKSPKSKKSKGKRAPPGLSSVPENTAQGLATKRMLAKQKAAAILKKINVAKNAENQKNVKTKESLRNNLSAFEKHTKVISVWKKENPGIEVMETDSESEDDSKQKSNVKPSISQKIAKKATSRSRKLLSSDEEEEKVKDKEKVRMANYWAEVYIENDAVWICADLITGKVNSPDELYKRLQKPVLYVVAWNSDGLIKDVTRRYCPQWLTVTRKQRISEDWWDDAVHSWKEKKDAASRAEDELLLKRELELPLPKTISECKGHPLYAIPRHLLKYEALYPPDLVPLGYLPNGEPIYPRFCVHTLMSRQTWLKHARVVKPAQEAYKIVKSMAKYDKMTGTMTKDQNLELFGKWQTDPYVPPVAKDGVVPRNEFGNVDLFKMSMLPKGTVHIDLPGLVRVARKLDIDCAPAVVGFNFGGRGATPATEGYVVCSEFEHVLRDAWRAEQVEARKRAKEKRQKAVYGNWKKIIKGLMIRKRLAFKYEFNNDNEEQATTSSAESPPKKKKVS